MIGDLRGTEREAEELKAEHDRLTRSLREIEDERDAGELPETDYVSLRDDYRARLADVSARLDQVGQPADGPSNRVTAEEESGPSSSPASGNRRRRLRVVVAVAGLLLLGAGAGLLVSAASGSRQSGQSVSGSVPPSAAQDLVAARHAMSTGDYTIALKLYRAVLSAEPNQPEALAYSGWLLRLSGDATGQTDLINQAVAAERAAEAADPAYPDPHFFLGVILLEDLHDPTAAVPQLQAYLGTHPSAAVQAAVGPVLARAQKEAAQSSGPPATP